MKVVWRRKAADELKQIYEFIRRESPQNAVLVFNKIYELAESLADFPYKFPIDPIINLEHVRFTAIFSFKIIYAVHKDSVVILRVFNTNQNPTKLKF
ncbi:type II toxin-antitoxin system RelE/ParE family toxin [Flavobacterium sp. 3HN19-14]|uniref:type II toxin-antitoxin system RelE/ParE family toxin n=1 Tax=Flavobacterium sp. 3HN19-14 TaxID=3448133 RepID=UPI003EDF6BB8